MTSQQSGVPKTEANIAKPLNQTPYLLHTPTRPSPLGPSLQSGHTSHHNSPLNQPPYDPRPTYPVYTPTRSSPLGASLQSHHGSPLSQPPYNPRPTYLHTSTRPSPLDPSPQSRQASHHNSLQDTPSGQYPAAISTTPFVPYHYCHYSPFDWQSSYLIPTPDPTLHPPPQSRQAGYYSYRPDIPSKNVPAANSIIPVTPRYDPSFDSRSSRPLQAPTHRPLHPPPQNEDNFYGSRNGPHTLPPPVEQGVLSGKKR